MPKRIYIGIKNRIFGGLVRFLHLYYVVDKELLEEDPFSVIIIGRSPARLLHRKHSIVYSVDGELYENSLIEHKSYVYMISFRNALGAREERARIVPPVAERSKIIDSRSIYGQEFVFSSSDRRYHLDVKLDKRYIRLFSIELGS